jgi:hypothetical protein
MLDGEGIGRYINCHHRNMRYAVAALIREIRAKSDFNRLPCDGGIVHEVPRTRNDLIACQKVCGRTAQRWRMNAGS